MPIAYEGLPDTERFLTMCKNIVKIMKQNLLFRYHNIDTVIAEELFEYVPYLIKNIIPPKEMRYNSRDGWLGVADQIRRMLPKLKSDDFVEEGSTIKYPALPQKDIVVAIIPADARISKEIYEKEKHFGNNASLWGSPHKTILLSYHAGIIDDNRNILNSIIKEHKAVEIASQLISVCATDILNVDDVLMEIIKIEFGYQKECRNEKNDPFKRLRVLFYGSHACSLTTLKKAILLFDDIHFYDHPAVKFGENWGMVGGPSYMRNFAYALAEHGVPVLIHKQLPGSLFNVLKDSVAYELRDQNFSKVVFGGFKNEEAFRNRIIGPQANYGGVKGIELIQSMLKLDLGAKEYILENYLEAHPHLHDPNNKESMIAMFAHHLMMLSVELSFACSLCYEHDLVPFTEYTTFDKLLTLRYKRAAEHISTTEGYSGQKLVHISQKIFDSIIPEEELDKCPIEKVVKYRKETREHYDRFRQYLMKLNSEIEVNVFNEKFKKELNRLIDQEVIPEAEKFKSECSRIWEKMFGSISKGVAKFATGSLIVSLLTGISWLEILTKGCAVVLVPTLVDYALENRNIKRSNSLTYLMQLKK